MTNVRAGVLMAIEKEYGSGKDPSSPWIRVPPATEFTWSDGPKVKELNGSGTRITEGYAYGFFTGTWTMKGVLDYDHIEWLLGVFSEYFHHNDIHSFDIGNGKREKTFAFLSPRLNRIAGGPDDSDALYEVKGCKVNDFKLNKGSDTSETTFELSGFLTDEELSTTELDDTMYAPPAKVAGLTEYCCVFFSENDDGPTDDDYVANVSSVGISLTHNAQPNADICGNISKTYSEGRVGIKWDLSLYCTDPDQIQRRVYSGGKDSLSNHAIGKGMAPLKHIYLLMYSSSMRDSPDLTSRIDAYNRSRYKVKITLDDCVFKTKTMPGDGGSKLMDTISGAECTNMHVEIQNGYDRDLSEHPRFTLEKDPEEDEQPYEYEFHGGSLYLTGLKDGFVVEANYSLPEYLVTHKGRITQYRVYDNVFKGRSMRSLTVGPNVLSIGDSAFENCGIETLTILGNTTLGNGSFYGCPVASLEVPLDVDLSKSFSSTALTRLRFRGASRPVEYTQAQQDTLPWKMATTTVLELDFAPDVSLVPAEMFKGCGQIGKVVFETADGRSSLRSIGDSAFENCINLAGGVTIQALSDKRSGNKAFKGCVKLTSVTFGTSVSVIGKEMFKGCTSLTNVTLGVNIQVLPMGVFEGCFRLSAINTENVRFFNSKCLATPVGGTADLGPISCVSLISVSSDAFEGFRFKNAEGATVIPDIRFAGIILTRDRSTPEPVYIAMVSSSDGPQVEDTSDQFEYSLENVEGVYMIGSVTLKEGRTMPNSLTLPVFLEMDGVNYSIRGILSGALSDLVLSDDSSSLNVYLSETVSQSYTVSGGSLRLSRGATVFIETSPEKWRYIHMNSSFDGVRMGPDTVKAAVLAASTLNSDADDTNNITASWLGKVILTDDISSPSRDVGAATLFTPLKGEGTETDNGRGYTVDNWPLGEGSFGENIKWRSLDLTRIDGSTEHSLLPGVHATTMAVDGTASMDGTGTDYAGTDAESPVYAEMDELVVKDGATIPAGAYKNVSIRKLTISGSCNLTKGAFDGCRIGVMTMSGSGSAVLDDQTASQTAPFYGCIVDELTLGDTVPDGLFSVSVVKTCLVEDSLSVSKGVVFDSTCIVGRVTFKGTTSFGFRYLFNNFMFYNDTESPVFTRSITSGTDRWGKLTYSVSEGVNTASIAKIADTGTTPTYFGIDSKLSKTYVLAVLDTDSTQVMGSNTAKATYGYLHTDKGGIVKYDGTINLRLASRNTTSNLYEDSKGTVYYDSASSASRKLVAKTARTAVEGSVGVGVYGALLSDPSNFRDPLWTSDRSESDPNGYGYIQSGGKGVQYRFEELSTPGAGVMKPHTGLVYDKEGQAVSGGRVVAFPLTRYNGASANYDKFTARTGTPVCAVFMEAADLSKLVPFGSNKDDTYTSKVDSAQKAYCHVFLNASLTDSDQYRGGVSPTLASAPASVPVEPGPEDS